MVYHRFLQEEPDMSKVICDICGTSYSENAANCPICGSSREYAVNASEDDLFPNELVPAKKLWTNLTAIWKL